QLAAASTLTRPRTGRRIAIFSRFPTRGRDSAPFHLLHHDWLCAAMAETLAHVTRIDATPSPLICLWRDWRMPLTMSARYGVSAPPDTAEGHEVHRVLKGHVPLAKEPYGGAFCLGEHGHQHIGPGNLLTAGRLDMDHRTLNNAMKGSGRSGVVAVGIHQCPKFGIDVIDEIPF